MKRDTFSANEVDIFKGVQRWINKNPTGDRATVLALVRLPLMEFSELFSTVKGSGLVNTEQLLEAIENKITGFCSSRKHMNIIFVGPAVSDFDAQSHGTL